MRSARVVRNKRHDRVAGERQRQQHAGLRFAQPDADQVEHQHDGQGTVREQPDEAGREKQPAVTGEPLECRGGEQSRQYQLSAISNQQSVQQSVLSNQLLSSQFGSQRAVPSSQFPVPVPSSSSAMSTKCRESVYANAKRAVASGTGADEYSTRELEATSAADDRPTWNIRAQAATPESNVGRRSCNLSVLAVS